MNLSSEEIATLVAERDLYYAALLELVRLKTIKERMRESTIPAKERAAMQDDYRKNQPRAWAKARVLVDRETQADL